MDCPRSQLGRGGSGGDDHRPPTAPDYTIDNVQERLAAFEDVKTIYATIAIQVDKQQFAFP